DKVQLTAGVSELYGRVSQDSQVFSYSIPPVGGTPLSSGEGTPLGSAQLSDWRSFGGIYGQARWKLTPSLGLLAGLRLNRTDECKGDSDDCGAARRVSTTRLSGSVGVNWRVWQDPEADLDDVVLYASYGNTFQPSQIDFGPDEDEPLLKP